MIILLLLLLVVLLFSAKCPRTALYLLIAPILSPIGKVLLFIILFISYYLGGDGHA